MRKKSNNDREWIRIAYSTINVINQQVNINTLYFWTRGEHILWIFSQFSGDISNSGQFKPRIDLFQFRASDNHISTLNIFKDDTYSPTIEYEMVIGTDNEKYFKLTYSRTYLSHVMLMNQGTKVYKTINEKEE